MLLAMSKWVVPLLIFCLLAFAASVRADVIDDARKLLDEGRAGAAYERLSPLERSRWGEAPFDFAFARAALESGRPREAIAPLQRVLAVNPKDLPARAYLARAYFEAGMLISARAEFERVLEGNPPPEARKSISSYLAAIDTRVSALDPTQWSGYVEFGAGYTSNANNATADSGVAVPAFGNLVFTLASIGVKTGSPAATAAAAVSVRHRVSDDLQLFAGGRLNFLGYTASRAKAFDQNSFDLNAGVSKTLGPDVVSAAIDAQYYDVDYARFRRTLALTLQWQRAISERTRIGTFGQLGDVDYYPRSTQSIRDVRRYLAGVSVTHALDPASGTIVSVGLYAGTEDERSAGVAHLGRDFIGLRAAAETRVRQDVTLFAAATLERSEYGGTEPLFLTGRDDNFVELVAGASWRPARLWAVTPTLRYRKNDSNIPISAYDSWTAMITLRRNFP